MFLFRMILVHVLLLLLAAVGPSVALVCPFGWSMYYSMCVRYLGTGDFYTATNLCRTHGGRLIEPRSEETSNFFASLVLGPSAWLGIRDFRYVSTYEPIIYSRPFYSSQFAFLQPSGDWGSSIQTASHSIVCEYTETNTECPMVGVVYDEEYFSASQADCQDACQNTIGCTFWVHTGGQCGLRSYSPGGLAGGYQLITTTGFKNSLIPGSGRVLVGKTVKNVESAKSCQNLCAEDDKCNSFTWTLYDYVFSWANFNTCILNYGERSQVVDTAGLDWQKWFVVSGPPCCRELSPCQERNYKQYTASSHNLGAASEKSLIVLPSPEELEKYGKELEERIRNVENKHKNETDGKKEETNKNKDRKGKSA